MQELINQMQKIPSTHEGIDIILLSCNSKEQGLYWEKRLDEKRGIIIGHHTEVISVPEEWPAGNGLGTLLAFQQANKTHNLFDKLGNGASIAMFHMAGKGTRLAPLSLAEYNNKPAVLLPALHPKHKDPLSILEMVILNTQCFAKAHKGRLLVMWSDQLFLPSVEIQPPTKEIEIFAKRISPPTKETWTTQNLSQYGLILEGTQLINKVSYENYQKLNKKASHISLGSFSLSPKLLQELLETHADSTTPLDTDPHFWIPMTHDPKRAHLFGVQDIGPSGHWWDFGSVNHYYHNVMKLLKNTPESATLRSFFGITHDHLQNNSILINSTLQNCHIENSILVEVTASNSHLKDTLSIHSRLHSLDAKHALLYNALQEERNSVIHGSIRADLYRPEHRPYVCPLRKSNTDIWSTKLKPNPLSFKEQYDFTNQL